MTPGITTSRPCPPGHVHCGNPDPPADTTVPTTTEPPNTCVANFIADSFCDDENNMLACDWDGGDCCGAAIQKLYCVECFCLDPSLAPYYNCGDDNTTQCTHPEWEADQYCDDANNNCLCNWDGGDCCGSDNSYQYCTECACLDIAYEDAFCHAGCGLPQHVGDDFCDDENNNCGCDWDGGDCCGKNKHSTYCEVCACLDPAVNDGPDHVNCVQGCDSLTFYADGFCDDANNVCGCDWDGGDCCGGAVNFRYCTECNCEDPSYVCPSDGECENTEYLNDLFCDDGNNNCACNWDHGDCCGPDNYYGYCTECKCKDTAYADLSCSGHCGVTAHRGDGFVDRSFVGSLARSSVCPSARAAACCCVAPCATLRPTPTPTPPPTHKHNIHTHALTRTNEQTLHARPHAGSATTPTTTAAATGTEVTAAASCRTRRLSTARSALAWTRGTAVSTARRRAARRST